ncbi:Early nodulin-like protein [Drosera capensis]
MGSPMMKRVVMCWFVMVIAICVGCCEARTFSVGGRDGWVVAPPEGFNHWSQRNRFLVNDVLNFKYKKGEDSVLVVTKDDYYTCNTANPLLTLSTGDDSFTLDRSGPFFFISGVKARCDDSQKLLVVVLAVRHPVTTPRAAAPLPTSTATPITAPSPSIIPSPSPSTSSASSPESPAAPAGSPEFSPGSAAAPGAYSLAPSPTAGGGETLKPKSAAAVAGGSMVGIAVSVVGVGLMVVFNGIN